jgi:hypothetical protein
MPDNSHPSGRITTRKREVKEPPRSDEVAVVIGIKLITYEFEFAHVGGEANATRAVVVVASGWPRTVRYSGRCDRRR